LLAHRIGLALAIGLPLAQLPDPVTLPSTLLIDRVTRAVTLLAVDLGRGRRL
jgi:hypothetical protein